MRLPRSLLVSIATTAVGCVTLAPSPATMPRDPVGIAVTPCAALRREHQLAVAHGDHVPFEVRLASALVTEAAFAERLAAAVPGQATRVVARAGAGKSRLAWALESGTCDRLPTVRIDADRDLRGRLALVEGDRPALLAIVAERLAWSGDGDPLDGVLAALAGRPWLLMVDGADELPTAARTRLLSELSWLEKHLPPYHLATFERTGSDTAGRSASAVATLPDLTCAQVDAAWGRRFADVKARATAQAWRVRHGMDRKSAANTECHFVHLRTWRDIGIAGDLAADAMAGVDDLPLDPGYAALHGTWLAHRLAAVTPDASVLWQWLDRVLSLDGEAAPDGLWTGESCTAVASPQGVESSTACSSLARSVAVRPASVAGAWTFSHPTLTDLAVARWLVRRHSRCTDLAAAVVADRTLQSMSLVVGLPAGRACLPDIVTALCAGGSAPDDLADRLDQALAASDRWRSSAGGADPCTSAAAGARLRSPRP